MGRKNLKEARQKEIIIGFYNVAKREGLENTSIAKVAKEIDVNPSLIIHYFNSKDELILGLINYILERYKSIYTLETNLSDVESKLINIINNLFSRKWNTYIDDGVFYSCFSLIFRSKRIKEEFVKVHEYLRQELTAVIQEAIENDIIKIKLTANQAADIIYIMVEGSYYYLSLFDNDDIESTKKLKPYRENTFSILNLKMVKT